MKRTVSKEVFYMSVCDADHGPVCVSGTRNRVNIRRTVLATLVPLTWLALPNASQAKLSTAFPQDASEGASLHPSSVVSPALAPIQSLLAAPVVSSLTPEAVVATGPLSNATRLTGGNVIEALGTDSIAVGLNAHANGTSSVAVGSYVSAGAEESVALGTGASSKGVGASALGVRSIANADRALAIGWRATVGANASDSLAIGSMSEVGAAGAGAIGQNNVVGGVNSYVLGNGNTALGAGSFVLGNNASATGSNSVVLGSSSDGSQNNVVSVGNVGTERRITHVAAGTSNTDAVNLSQLQALGARTDAGGTPTNAFAAYDTKQASVLTLAGTAGTTITNLKAGALNEQSTDAVNGAQLNATNQSVASTAANTAANAAANLSAATASMVSYADAGKSTITLGGSGGTIISNVKAGVADQDAVNVAQLKSAGIVDSNGNALSVVTYDTNANGSVNRSSVTLGGVGASSPVALHNIAAGSVSAGSTDAVNGGQLFQTEQRVANLQNGNAQTYFNTNTALRAARASGAEATAIGGNAQASANNSVALGTNAIADRDNSVSVGAAGNERQITNVAAGTADTDAVNVAQLKSAGIVDQNGKSATVLTYDKTANGTTDLRNVTIGQGIAGGTVIHNVASGTLSTDAVNVGQLDAAVDRVTNVATTLGSFFSADGNASTEAATASGTHSVAIGASAIGSGANATAIGALSSAPGTSATALGAGATASAGNSVALGANSVADRANSVSVGVSGGERQIINVAPATFGTDAINLNQLNRSASSTLSLANGYTDQRFNSTQQQINDLDRSTRKGIASASALNVVTPYLPGRTTLNAGVATYRGQAALGIGVSRWNDKGNINFNAGVSSSGSSSTIVRAGVGYVFGS
jgi:trimeric autotransporter adhesin